MNFTKVTTREFTLLLWDIVIQAETKEIDQIVHTPEIQPWAVVEINNGVGVAYLNDLKFALFNEAIIFTLTKNDQYFKSILEHFTDLTQKYKQWQEKKLSHQDFCDFLQYIALCIPGVMYSFHLPTLKIPLEIKEAALKLRILNEDFMHKSDMVIRNSLFNLYPSLGELSFFLNVEEVTTQKIPPLSELESRREYLFVYHNAIFIHKDKTSFSIENNLTLQEIRSIFLKGNPTIYQQKKIRGKVKIVTTRNELAKIQLGDILVSPMITTNYYNSLHKVRGIITNEGGITSHAAIVSRELGIPCIVGTMTATDWLHDNDEVEMDLESGIIQLIE